MALLGKGFSFHHSLARSVVTAHNQFHRPDRAIGGDAPKQVLTPRTAAWTVLRPPDWRGSEGRALLVRLRETVPILAATVELVEEFAVLVRGSKPEHLDPWLHRAQDSMVLALQRFARRVSSDYDAVRAAVTLAWSSGQVEGQINRLKTLKRQMLGRANLDLLERRFLLAA